MSRDEAARMQHLQDGVENLVEKIERQFIRPERIKTFECCIDCCKDDSLRQIELQNCLTSCTDGMQRIEEVVNQELAELQNRLQRCANQCQDQAKLQVPPDGNLSADRKAALQGDLQSCVNRCVDQQLKSLPQVEKRIQYGIRRVSG
ncbi:hypothetical protein KFL_000760220 [Klebsormidium nitens]|uniref:Protein FAM136A n=1 Tax=Klebsormidium nitens TaxID=105231 RepID=A0A1Y1HT49_KLENI|nr:hypothetical protein KFL_000760220 [Klebsormidium nitens]|eukprot:GAQ81293.1 hypothetical protein KFL_000760220 [Klebsormidium nitens]